jgi:hypothetical protein
MLERTSAYRDGDEDKDDDIGDWIQLPFTPFATAFGSFATLTANRLFSHLSTA